MSYKTSQTLEKIVDTGEVFLRETGEKINGVQEFKTLSEVKDATNLKMGSFVRTLGYYSPGDGGGNDYEIVAAGTGTDDGGSFIDLSGSGLQAKGLFGNEVCVEQFGAKRDGVSRDTVSIQSAINYISSLGGGKVSFSSGTYLIHDDNGDGIGIQVQTNNILLKGVPGGSRILLDDTAPERFLMINIGIFPVTSGTNGDVDYEDITIDGLEFDGNYIVNTNDSDDQNALLKMTGVRRFTLRNCYLHGSTDYGISFQNGGHVDFLLENIVVEDVLQDGIDIKNNGSSDEGGRMDNCVFRRCCQGQVPSIPASIDLMGRVVLNNIHVSEFGQVNPGVGIRFKQGEFSDGRGIGAHGSSLTNFSIIGTYDPANPSSTPSHVGFTSIAYDCHISNGYISNMNGHGLRFMERESTASGITVQDSKTGFWLAGPTPSAEFSGKLCNLLGCYARSCSTGFLISEPQNIMTSCVSMDCDIGVHFESSGSDCSWNGGQISGSSVQRVKNLASGTKIRDTLGFRTKFSSHSPVFPVNSIGQVTVTSDHKLDATPSARHIVYSIGESDGAGWGIRNSFVKNVNSTSFDVEFTVDKEGTSGNVSRINFIVDISENIPEIP